MQIKELIDKRVVVVASVSLLFMLSMLLALLATNTKKTNTVTTQAAVKEDVTFGFNKKSLSLTGNDLSVDVLVKTKTTNKVSAATVSIKYPADLLTFDNADNLSENCLGNNPKLDTSLAINNNAQTGVLEITRTALLADEQLPGGTFCFVTLNFETKENEDAQTAGKQITFNMKATDSVVVGPKVKYSAKVDQANSSVSLQ